MKRSIEEGLIATSETLNNKKIEKNLKIFLGIGLILFFVYIFVGEMMGNLFLTGIILIYLTPFIKKALEKFLNFCGWIKKTVSYIFGIIEDVCKFFWKTILFIGSSIINFFLILGKIICWIYSWRMIFLGVGLLLMLAEVFVYGVGFIGIYVVISVCGDIIAQKRARFKSKIIRND